MDRKLYLELCQKVSVLKNVVCGIKENVPNELKVIYNGIAYYPVAYELSFDDKGNVRHTVILHDLYANSTTEADLERVIKYDQRERKDDEDNGSEKESEKS